jgi:hypothetical protein
MEKDRTIKRIPRRKFLGWVVPLIGSSVIVFSFKSIYSGSFNNLLLKLDQKYNFKTTKSNKNKDQRKRWNIESLILNKDSNVVHYPSKYIFTYYDQISEKNISTLEFNNWKEQVKSPIRFIKSKSGIILENLTLKELSFKNIKEMDSEYKKAIETISIAFNNDYINSNIHNWRIYDLLIQLITFNTRITNKWAYFSSIVNLEKIKYLQIIPKRNNWVKSEKEFILKVNEIIKKRETIIVSLRKRVKRAQESQ